jgi:nitroreductase
MDVYEAVNKRRSIRAYKDQPVPEEVLLRVLEVARLAPSAHNSQEWRFIVVTDPETLHKLVKAAKGQKFVGQAPALIAFCSTKSRIMTCGQDAGPIDNSIALAYVTLAAVAEGLGTCWLGAFYQDQARQILGVPEDVDIIGMTPLGYPAESPKARPRKSMDQVLFREKWNGGEAT